MTTKPRERTELLQGTLDMLILRTLILGPAHGHEIAKHIQRTSDEVLRLEHGSLYPALHRLERKGWLVSKWDAHREHNRECKYYRLTRQGAKRLSHMKSEWRTFAGKIERLMDAATAAERNGRDSQ